MKKTNCKRRVGERTIWFELLTDTVRLKSRRKFYAVRRARFSNSFLKDCQGDRGPDFTVC